MVLWILKMLSIYPKECDFVEKYEQAITKNGLHTWNSNWRFCSIHSRYLINVNEDASTSMEAMYVGKCNKSMCVESSSSNRHFSFARRTTKLFSFVELGEVDTGRVLSEMVYLACLHVQKQVAFLKGWLISSQSELFESFSYSMRSLS